MKKLKLGFLSSHNGSNMQVIINACKSGELNMIPVVIISNNPDCETLKRAKRENIPNYHISSKTNPVDEDEAISKVLKKHNVDLIILAGYMKKIGSKTLKKYKGKILNIHPALLPKFGGEGMYGLNVHRAVLSAKEKESGATIHLIDEIYDNGKILNQVKVAVLPQDTSEILQDRILKEEYKLYINTLKMIEKGEIVL
jgi:phosphoribosylglycinamide formyltransferase-1